LGSTALLTYGLTAVGGDHAAAGDPVPNTLARYTPFGDWRTEPTAGLTNRGYTRHRHNAIDELLTYRLPPPRWQPPKRRGRLSNEMKALIAQWCQ
ncbi:MAG: hypothetical protein KC425_01730, partial [Anaerolineales bacterium]|nr:hypothetical protein [Anaerolineales bacterium]